MSVHNRTEMVDTPVSVATPAMPRVSWGAILAGAVVAIAIGTMLNLLGVAGGFAMVDPLDRSTPEASSFAWMSGAFLAVTTAVSLFVGTAVAARLAGTWNEGDALLHGFVTWAASILLAAVLVGSAVSGGLNATLRAAGATAGAVASTAAPAATAAAAQFNPAEAMDYIGNRFFGRATPSDTREDNMREAVQLMADRFRTGSWQGQDKARMVALVGQLTGLAPAEAEARVNEAERAAQAAIQQAEQTAREAADAAATAISVSTFWAFATALLGLAAAALGAKYGARGPLVYVPRSSSY